MCHSTAAVAVPDTLVVSHLGQVRVIWQAHLTPDLLRRFHAPLRCSLQAEQLSRLGLGDAAAAARQGCKCFVYLLRTPRSAVDALGRHAMHYLLICSCSRPQHTASISTQEDWQGRSAAA